MEWVQFTFSAISIFLGLVSIVIGVFGSLRFKFILNRMHAAAIIDTMGIFLICLGCAIANGFDSTSIKILSVAIFLWFTSPIASHLISKLEFITDKDIAEEIENDLSEIMEDNQDDSI